MTHELQETSFQAEPHRIEDIFVRHGRDGEEFGPIKDVERLGPLCTGSCCPAFSVGVSGDNLIYHDMSLSHYAPHLPPTYSPRVFRMSATRSSNFANEGSDDEAPAIVYDPNDPFWDDSEGGDDDDIDYLPAQDDIDSEDEGDDDEGTTLFHGIGQTLFVLQNMQKMLISMGRCCRRAKWC